MKGIRDGFSSDFVFGLFLKYTRCACISISSLQSIWHGVATLTLNLFSSKIHLEGRVSEKSRKPNSSGLYLNISKKKSSLPFMKHNLNVVLGCYSLMLLLETAPEVDLKINRSSLWAYMHIHKSIAPVFF